MPYRHSDHSAPLHHNPIANLFLTKPIEVVLGLVAGSAIFGAVSYHNNMLKEGKIPLAFSGIEYISDAADQNGQKVPPLTQYFALTSDIPMKIFESNNIARAKDDKHVTFARELETRIDPLLKRHALLSDLARLYPATSQNALTALTPYRNINRDLAPIITNLQNAWDEDHDHQYRTEFYTVRSCDSKGHCTSSPRTRQVYSHTIHTFTYHASYGAEAARLMEAFKAAHPNVKPPEKLIRATKVSPDNFEAIRTSMKDKFKDKALDMTDALKLTNTWNNGSTYSLHVPSMQTSFNGFSQTIPAWQGGAFTARSDSYRTSSHSDDGPKEYQIVETAIKHAQSFSEHHTAIINGIQTAERDVPRLNRLVTQYVDVVLNNGKGDPDQLREDIMKTAQKIYNSNYPKGFDVEPFNGWEIFGLTLLGGLVGGGLGYGADRGIDSLYRRRQQKRKQMN